MHSHPGSAYKTVIRPECHCEEPPSTAATWQTVFPKDYGFKSTDAEIIPFKERIATPVCALVRNDSFFRHSCSDCIRIRVMISIKLFLMLLATLSTVTTESVTYTSPTMFMKHRTKAIRYTVILQSMTIMARNTPTKWVMLLSTNWNPNIIPPTWKTGS